MRDLRLVPLTSASIARAYPLIQIALPRMMQEEWQNRAEAILSQDDPGRLGIQTLQDPRGLIVGLFVYRVLETGDHGPTLFVDTFVAVDIVAAGRVADRLAREMERLARMLGCHAVHTAVACEGKRGDGIISLLSALGHYPETTQLCKPLGPPA